MFNWISNFSNYGKFLNFLLSNFFIRSHLSRPDAFMWRWKSFFCNSWHFNALFFHFSQLVSTEKFTLFVTLTAHSFFTFNDDKFTFESGRRKKLQTFFCWWDKKSSSEFLVVFYLKCVLRANLKNLLNKFKVS